MRGGEVPAKCSQVDVKCSIGAHMEDTTPTVMGGRGEGVWMRVRKRKMERDK